jgi:hypothetical protein
VEAFLSMRREQARLRDEVTSMSLDASTASTDPHAHLSHRNLPIASAQGTRARLPSWWAVLRTPLIVWTIAQIVHPLLGINAWQTMAGSLIVLVSIEGFARGKFLAVMGRFLLIIVAVVALYFLWHDWRIFVGTVLAAASLTILVVNLREAFRR